MGSMQYHSRFLRHPSHIISFWFGEILVYSFCWLLREVLDYPQPIVPSLAFHASSLESVPCILGTITLILGSFLADDILVLYFYWLLGKVVRYPRPSCHPLRFLYPQHHLLSSLKIETIPLVPCILSTIHWVPYTLNTITFTNCNLGTIPCGPCAL